MSNVYHATPYDISAAGFYFSSYDEYLEKAASHRNEYGDPVEEYEIQAIELDAFELFDALKINQATLKIWLDQFEDMDEEEQAKAIYLITYQGVCISDVQSQIDDVCLTEQTPEDYVYDYLEDTGLMASIPASLRYYFDIEAMALDMLLNGDIIQVELGGRDYIALP